MICMLLVHLQNKLYLPFNVDHQHVSRNLKSPGGQTADGFLQLNDRECAGVLHLGVVCRLHSCREESPAVGDEDSSENHQLPSALCARQHQLPLSQ